MNSLLTVILCHVLLETCLTSWTVCCENVL